MKIKSIQIDNFRVYSSGQDFNFSNGSKVADFVVIYAPNGFGKTSFIDAIEWSFTDRIERFNNNANIKELLENEKRVFKEKEDKLCILRNVNNPENKAHIRIVSDKDEILEVESKDFIGTKRCDYIISTKKENVNRQIIKKECRFEHIYEEDFKINNLITSDMINSFLQLDDPKERFNILHKFWDKNDEYNFYKKLLELNKQLKDKTKSTKKDIKDKKNKLKEYKSNDDKLKLFNDLVNKFNSIGILEQQIDIIKRDNVQEYNIKQFEEIRLKLQKIIDLSENKLSKLQILLSDNDKYNMYILNIENINKNKIIVEKIVDMFARVRKINELIELNEIKFNLVDDKCKKYKYIIDNSNIYLEKLNKNTKLKLEINKLQKDTEVYIKIKKENLDNIRLLKVEQKTKQIEYIEFEEKYNKIKSKYKKINNNDAIINYIKKMNSTFNNAELKYTGLIKFFSEYIDVLKKVKNSLIEKAYINNISIKNKNHEISSLIKECNILIKSYNDNTDEICRINKNNEYMENQKEKMVDFIKSSFSLIDEDVTNRCPLCNHEFDNYADLKVAIIENLNDDSIKNKLNEEIKNKENLLKKNESTSKEIAILYEKIDTLKNNYETILESLLRNQEKLNNKKIIINRKLKQKLNEQVEIKIFLEEHSVSNFIDEYEKFEKTLDEKKKSYIYELKKISDKLDSIDKQLEKAHNSIEDISLKMQEKNSNITSNNNINEIVTINEILKYHGIELKDSSDKLIINTKLESDINNKNSIKEKLDKLKTELLKLRLALLFCNEETITEELRRINENIQHKENYIKEYRNTYNQYMKVVGNINLDTIKDEIDRINSEKNIGSDKLTLLNSIIDLLDIVRKCREELKFQNEVEQLTYEYEKIKSKIFELGSITKECEKYLNNKITAAFNLKVINSIYQMIDPHPDLENIKFIPEFTEKDTKIHIHAFNEKKELAPILYFSSAQVSILALSIFYAQILKNKSILDTIFMDDPIQHLDSINTLAFIDLMRSMITQPNLNKQIILTTNNSEFYELLKLKLNPNYYNSKFITLESYGEIKNS